VRRWLEPLPDKSLPSLNIQRAFFPILLGMEIDTISLKMSGLGKVVLFYSMCGRVEAGIRRIADRLIGECPRSGAMAPVLTLLLQRTGRGRS
jgi:transcription factor SPN1